MKDKSLIESKTAQQAMPSAVKDGKARMPRAPVKTRPFLAEKGAFAAWIYAPFIP